MCIAPAVRSMIIALIVFSRSSGLMSSVLWLQIEFGIIQMVALDGLQGLDGVRGIALQETHRAEIAQPRADQLIRLVFDRLHLLIQVVIGVDDVPILAIQDAEMAGRDLHRIHFSAFVYQQVVVTSRTVRDQRAAHCIRQRSGA